MKFEDYQIDETIKTNLNLLGFIRPTDIQYKAIHPILKGEDVLAIAQTGTGKTAAFVIPVLHKLLQAKNKKSDHSLRCLVMEPTHELSLQITEVFHQLSRNTGIRTMSLIGGVEQDPQISQLNSGVDILVTTPGRMFDLVSQGHLSLHGVEMLVLDEADHMLDLGFIKDIVDLKRLIKGRHQTLFFSATINETIKKISYSLVKNPIRIQISPKDPVAKNINHSVFFVDMDNKRFFLERIINEHPESKILVFVRTKVRAERVKAAMTRVNISSETLHSDKDQKSRKQVMEDFHSGQNKILIATDVSARGIDIPDVDYVINFDISEDPRNYVHRVGRTGRGTKKGIAVSFCSKEEEKLLSDIESYTGSKIAVLEINPLDYKGIIDFSAETKNDWKTLLKEDDIESKNFKVKKKKKKK